MAQFETWLRELRAAGKGGVRLKPIDRGLPYSLSLEVSADWSADSFDAALRLYPDAAGSPLVAFTIVVGAYTAGATVITLSLTQVQTANTAIIPPDTAFDGAIDLAFDLLRTPAGGAQTRILGGVIPVLGKVSNYG